MSDILMLIMAVLGLLLPGYASARLLGLRASWAVAFPFSALLMSEFVIVFSAAGVPIRFNLMALALGGWTFLNLVLLLCRGRDQGGDVPEAMAEPPGRFEKSILWLSLLIVTAVGFRTALYPLSGFDTFFRWDALARQMLQYESISHYPPVTAADFSIYVYPDGIPPLVATVYWWLYAAIGRPLMQVTSISVVLQLLSAMALTYYGTCRVFGVRAAFFSLLAFSTSTLLISGFAIGQETGYTALSVAGQLYCAWVAVRRPRLSPIFAAGAFAALGALARDYGPVLALAGFMILAWDAQTRRYLWLFVLTAVLLASPWYLRNWMMTGNPVYPHVIPGGFSSNPVMAAILNSYRDVFAFYQYDASQWATFSGILFAGAPLALVGGGVFGAARWRESGALMIASGVVVLVWLWSIGFTAGGVIYSMRVLTPVFVMLSVLAGAAGAMVYAGISGQGRTLRLTAMIAVLSLSAYSAAFSLSHPFSGVNSGSAFMYAHSGTPEMCLNTQELAEKLQATAIPKTGVLTSNAYLATILQRNTRFRPVMLWSPEVRFLFEPGNNALDVRRQLLEKNIRIIYIHNDSVNNYFSMNFSFFDILTPENRQASSQLIADAGGEAFYYLSTVPCR
jgi:hypothetical protein